MARDDDSLATFENMAPMSCLFHLATQFAKWGGKAHHEMEWFFPATEDSLRRTSIMVVKTTYASMADSQASAVLLVCWQTQRRNLGCDRFREMDVFQGCERTEETAPPMLESASRPAHRKRACFPRLGRWRQRATSLKVLSTPCRGRILFLFCCIALSGCRSRHGVAGPSIEFTRVPPAVEGSPDKIDIIEGRVIGARPGQQIVLYAKSGTWWVQPLVGEAFTKIQPDSKWINSTHLGTDYAALLVEPGYRPLAKINELPTQGGQVVTVAIARGGSSGAAVSKTILFSGYEWRVRDAPSDRGGKNTYDPGNARTDTDGALHLRITKVSDQWTCAEVTLTSSFGYGTYSFVVRDTSHLDPAAVFSMFTWDYAGTTENYREMDIEVSQWGDPTSKNAQYVVQPFYIPANAARFTAPSGVVTHSFRWEAGRVSFRTVRGSEIGSNSRPVAEHVFTLGVPSPGIASVRMNLYVFHGAKVPLQNGAEVVIEKFEYLP
jgi:hypothetical protein